MKHIFLIIVFSVFLSLQTLRAEDRWSDADPEKKEAVQLEEIVVTPNEPGNMGVSVFPDTSSVHLETYHRPGSVITVQDILETMAGVDIQRGDPALSDDRDVIKIRGLGARRIMIRIDGRPVRNAGGFGDTLVDWTSLSLEGIERVEVIRGPHSAVMGQTTGGTVNIITKKKKSREGAEPEITAQGDYSSYNTRRFTACITDNVSETDYSLAGGYRASDGYLRNSDYEILDFTGRVSYGFPSRGRVILGYKLSEQKKQPFAVNDPLMPDYDDSYPVLPLGAFETPYSANYDGGNDFYDKKTSYLDLIVEQPSSVGDWNIHLYHSRERRDAILYQLANNTYYDNIWNLNYEDYGLMIQNRLLLSENHHFTFGFDGNRMYGEYNTENPFRVTSSDKERWMTQLAGYIEYSWNAAESLEIVLGLRYDRAEIDLSMSDFEDTIDEWSPKSGLFYEFSPETTGFLFVSKAFRVPTAMEYGWIEYPTGRNLENETALVYEVGLLKELGALGSLRCAYYYYDIENYILFNNSLNPALAELAGRPMSDALFNADYLKLHGIEAELGFNISDSFSGYANYTYHDYDLGPMPVPVNEPRMDVCQIPRHKASLNLEWSPISNTKVMVALRYIGSRKTSRNESLSSFLTADTGIEYSFMDDKIRLKGYISNLFDKDYQEKYLIPAPERTFGVAIRYDY